jgi:membrane-associated phospholipid phosphatase
MRERAVRLFLLCYALVAVPLFIAVLGVDRFVLHKAMNAHHGDFGDLLLSTGTHLADGWVPTVLALLFLLKDNRSFMMVGMSALFSAIVTQCIKHFLFPGSDRPTMFLDHMPGLVLVPGVELLQHNSFPSGHTTAAYSVCLALAVIVGRPGAAIGLAGLAASLGFARVYLSQHFTEDVLAGATIGTLTAYLVYRWLYVSPFSRRAWLDRTLLRRQDR